jgi:hypothetical protein
MYFETIKKEILIPPPIAKHAAKIMEEGFKKQYNSITGAIRIVYNLR